MPSEPLRTQPRRLRWPAPARLLPAVARKQVHAQIDADAPVFFRKALNVARP
ncbi:hypothetical protein [Dyella sp. RRB7]|uniref:hypothetical protein n=1 Tax=Dyella sp. RRB7 TaxID=2919502 RepID=UPI001FAA87BF|nr:hypothetical protein [Dyella sp. RRB7]